MGTLVRTKNLFIVISLVKLNHSKKFYRRSVDVDHLVLTRSSNASFSDDLSLRVEDLDALPAHARAGRLI